jgi:hypothetical protein
MPPRRFPRKKENLRIKVLKQNMFNVCRENFPFEYQRFLAKRKRQLLKYEREQLTAVDRARIRLGRIKLIAIESEIETSMIVEEAIDAASMIDDTATSEPEPETTSIFNYNSLISMIINTFSFLWTTSDNE